MIGEGVRVKVCSNKNCEGGNWDDQLELVGPYNCPEFKDINDWVSYIEVYNYDASKEPRVMLLGKNNFDF